MTVGERICARRKELGISVDTLAEKIGKNRATIYRYEGNEIENMSIVILEPLAKALKTTPAYLMGWVEDKSSNIENLMAEPSILKKYNELNTIGKCKTDAYVDGLLENPNYRKDAERHNEEDGRRYTNITFDDNEEHIAALGGIKEDDDTVYTS
ncbi:MAG: helix-turn-helix transcriptional regulator [Clostridia bacterium]|nr:helix-turn-helix transcriptional regulator [Clostridia bacterium]